MDEVRLSNRSVLLHFCKDPHLVPLLQASPIVFLTNSSMRCRSSCSNAV